jgi:hypothetical protein
MHQFLSLESLTPDISEFFPGKHPDSHWHFWTLANRESFRHTINDFVKGFRGVNIRLVIYYKQQDFDTNAISNLKCIKVA